MFCLACVEEMLDPQDSCPVMFMYHAPDDTKQEVLAYL